MVHKMHHIYAYMCKLQLTAVVVYAVYAHDSQLFSVCCVFIVHLYHA